MIDCGSLEYATARLQARHGDRLDEAGWRRLEVVRGFAPLLEAARGTSLRPWLVGITADSSGPAIEATLRGHWRMRVAMVAAWMPPPWAAAVRWCAALPELPALQHLARGGEPTADLREDPAWRGLVESAPPARAAWLAASPWAPLAARGAAPQDIGGAWLAEWRRRWPMATGEAADTLARLAQVLGEHRAAFVRSAPGQGWLLRAALQVRLSQLLRRVALQPAVAFIHLALWALELERLRAELLRHRLFPNWRAA